MMRLMFLALIAASFVSRPLLAAPPAATAPKTPAVEAALETFAGTWEFVSVQPEGVTKEARRLVFRKEGTYAALDREGKELWAGTFEIDPTAAPKIWDHRTPESAKTGGDVLGIYDLDGDRLRCCCVVGTWKDKQWTGKPRPKEFRLEGADVLLELRRVKPAP